MRKASTLLLIAGLLAVAIVGCSGLIGQELTPLPLAAVPNSIVNHPVDNTPAPPVGANVGDGGNNGGGAAFFGQGVSRRLFLGCVGERAVDGTTVPDYNCADFVCIQQARDFKAQLDTVRTNNIDCHGLDGNIGGQDDNGVFCTTEPAVCP